jgi:hypothetical protein
LTRSLQVPLAALIGAVTGAVAILLVQSHLTPAAAPTQPVVQGAAPTGATPPPLRPADLATDRRLSALELQLRQLSRPGAASPEPLRGPPSPQDRYAAAERARQELAQRLADHDASARDSRWAAPRERVIADSVRKLAADSHQSFSLVDVDCRTTTCVARVQWADEATARVEIRNLMQNTDVDCARQVALPAAPNAGVGYRASVLFDCAPSTR